MSYHRLTSMACPQELIGFGSGSLRAEQSPDVILSALQQIVRDYENPDISHVDFRVNAGRLASNAIAHMASIPTYAGIPVEELARSGAFGWHPGDEA